MTDLHGKLDLIHVEPGVRELVEWDPPSVRQAMRQMFLGNFFRAGMLMDSLLGDMRTQSVLSVRVTGLDSREPSVTHSSKRVTQALLDDLPGFFGEDATFELRTSGWLAGAVLAQLVWDTSGARWIPRVEPWHVSLQRYDPTLRQWYVQTMNGEIPVTPGDGKWVLYAPGGRRRPWRRGMVRGLGLLHVLKTYDISDWASYNEVHGKPIRVGTGAVNREEVGKLAHDLSTLAGDSSLGLTAGRDVKLLEAVSQSWQSFKAQLEWVDTEIAIGILGQNLTTEVKGGSRAATDAHNMIRFDIGDGDASYESAFLHDQVLPHWYAMNFGGGEVPLVTRLGPTAEQTPLEEWHARYGTVSKNEVRERIGFDARPDGEDLITSAAPSPQPPPTPPSDPPQEAP